MNDETRTAVRRLLLQAAELINAAVPALNPNADLADLQRRYDDVRACDKILDAAALVK